MSNIGKSFEGFAKSPGNLLGTNIRKFSWLAQKSQPTLRNAYKLPTRLTIEELGGDKARNRSWECHTLTKAYTKAGASAIVFSYREAWTSFLLLWLLYGHTANEGKDKSLCGLTGPAPNTVGRVL